MNNKYRLTVNDRQLRLMLDAIEEYFRIRMGQFFQLSDDLCFSDFGNGYTKEEFDQAIKDRNEVLDMFKYISRIAFKGKPSKKTEEMQVGIDMWEMIRHRLWLDLPEPKSHNTTDAREPITFSDEPPIKIERLEQ
jgi:hypothetical protein